MIYSITVTGEPDAALMNNLTFIHLGA